MIGRKDRLTDVEWKKFNMVQRYPPPPPPTPMLIYWPVCFVSNALFHIMNNEMVVRKICSTSIRLFLVFQPAHQTVISTYENVAWKFYHCTFKRLCFTCVCFFFFFYWNRTILLLSVHAEQIVAHYEYFIEFYISTAGFLILSILSVFIFWNKQEMCSYCSRHQNEYTIATFLFTFFFGSCQHMCHMLFYIYIYMLKSLLQLYLNWFKCCLLWIVYIWFMFVFEPFFKRNKKKYDRAYERRNI